MALLVRFKRSSFCCRTFTARIIKSSLSRISLFKLGRLASNQEIHCSSERSNLELNTAHILSSSLKLFVPTRIQQFSNDANSLSHGATTFSTTTLGIKALSTKLLIATLSILKLSKSIKQGILPEGEGSVRLTLLVLTSPDQVL